MKKKYLTPEVDITTISFEQNILSNGESVSINTTYVDDDDFWA